MQSYSIRIRFMISALKLRSTFLCFLIGTLGSNVSAQESCDINTPYQGPEKLRPMDISRLPARSINLEQSLPEELSKVLQTAFSETLKLTQASAASISFYSPQYGYWNYQTGAAEESASIFWMESVSKLVTASIIFQLMDEKQLLLTDSLERWFPDLPGASLITIEQLLNHTSGLRDFTQLAGQPLDQSQLSSDQLIALISQSGLAFCPGSNWSYSNSGYLVLSKIASILDSKPWHEVVRGRISKPHNLETLQVPTLADKIDSLVIPTLGSVESFRTEISNSFGAASLVASTRDAIRLLALYLRGEIASSSTIAEAGNPLYPLFTEVMGYGKGIMITRVPDPNAPTIWVGHAGGSSRGKALLIFDVKRETYMAIALNTQAEAEAIANTLLKIYDQYVITRAPKKSKED